MGATDASGKLEPDGAWFACHTQAGPGTLRVRFRDGTWHHEGWGPGGDALVALGPAVCGLLDNVDAFEVAQHPRLRQLWSRNKNLRLGQAPSIFTTLVTVVLQQRVSWRDATRSNRLMNAALGAPAPGSEKLRLPPSPERLLALPTHAFHEFGVERKRAETIRRIAKVGLALETLRGHPPQAIVRELTAIRGVGPWTASMVLGQGFGNPDALPLGDYALPHTISWFFRKKDRSTDQEMVDLLEPFRPHRYRVVRLLWAAGVTAPRYGPRRPLRPIHRVR